MGGRGDLFLFSGDMLIYLIRVPVNGTSYKSYYVGRWGTTSTGIKWGPLRAKVSSILSQSEPSVTSPFPPGTQLIEIVSHNITKLAETYFRDKYANNFTSAVVFSSSYPTHKARKNLRIINAPKS